MSNKAEIFNKLNSINVNDKIKQKIGLNYLSWAYAWGILKQEYPDAEYKIYTRTIHTTTVKKIVEDGIEITTTTDEGEQELPYFTDGLSCFVKVGVIIEGVEYTEIFPVMDNSNKSIRANMITSMNVNKALQRAFVKCCARHGLGLYIYAGEDLPEEEKNKIPNMITAVTDFVNSTVKINAAVTELEYKANLDKLIKIVSSLTDQSAETKAKTTYAATVLQGVRMSQLPFNPESDLKIRKILTFIENFDKQ